MVSERSQKRRGEGREERCDGSDEESYGEHWYVPVWSQVRKETLLTRLGEENRESEIRI